MINTPNPIASIPQEIWEQDKHTWKAYYERSNATPATKARYKRTISMFYAVMEKRAVEWDKEDMDAFESGRKVNEAESTVKREMSVIRGYWKFARRLQAESEAQS